MGGGGKRSVWGGGGGGGGGLTFVNTNWEFEILQRLVLYLSQFLNADGRF